MIPMIPPMPLFRAPGFLDRHPPGRSGIFLPLCLCLFLAGTPASGKEATGEPVPIRKWLLLGPVAAPLPAFHEEKPGSFSLGDLLEGQQIRLPRMTPEAGRRVAWSPGVSLEWKPVTAGKEGTVSLEPAGNPGAAWLFTYLKVDRFQSLELKVSGEHLLQIDLDGETLATRAKIGKKSQDGSSGDANELSASLDLEPGVHRLLVKTIGDPQLDHPWSVSARIIPPETGLHLKITTSPEHPLELAQILDAPRPTEIALSADGQLAAITMQRIIPGTDDAENWIEVRRTGDGSSYRSYRGLELDWIRWAPVGNRFSYVTRGTGDQAKFSQLWIADLDSGETVPILERVERLGSHLWSTDGESLIFEITEEPPKDEIGIQRLEGLQDRRKGWRNRGYIYQMMITGGTRRRLTAGRLSTSPGSVSPDGSQLLFFRNPDDYRNRPYVSDELFLLDLDDLQIEPVHRGSWINDAIWSPDGRRLLVLGGPGAFDGIGRSTTGNVLPNNYDGQLYLMDLKTLKVETLSRDFDPSVTEMQWNPGDNRIYLRVYEGERVNLYRLDPGNGKFSRIDTPIAVVSEFSVAHDARILAWIGSSATRPPAVWVRKADREPVLLLEPASREYRHMKLGKVERFDFTNSRGLRIDGRVHFPPDFDPQRRYPAIVYYYGGTFPVSRSFGGRYPKNWWAGNGYLVYVPQPSGTIGYGQEFSALHVNAWGRYTSDDILEGVEAFLEAHPFVDPDRVGCIGASYGGFMTQFLLTKTERFAAGVSHAGISDLSSYWGEGYWGYAYSAVATAESFPWNRKELYVEQSPLFHADRIRTPLLLLHGTADVNVPPGESEQLYTALKLLDRPVEYVRIHGQDHHILKHDQRIVWSKTILAWFDKWLKDQPEWWDHLYPGVPEEEEE